MAVCTQDESVLDTMLGIVKGQLLRWCRDLEFLAHFLLG